MRTLTLKTRMVAGAVMAAFVMLSPDGAAANAKKRHEFDPMWNKVDALVLATMKNMAIKRCFDPRNKRINYDRLPDLFSYEGVQDANWTIQSEKLTQKSDRNSSRTLKSAHGNRFNRCNADATGDKEAILKIEVEGETKETQTVEVSHETEVEEEVSFGVGKEGIMTVDTKGKISVSTEHGTKNEKEKKTSFLDEVELAAEAGTLIQSKFRVTQNHATYNYDADLLLVSGAVALGVDTHVMTRNNRKEFSFLWSYGRDENLSLACLRGLAREVTYLRLFELGRLLKPEDRHHHLRAEVKTKRNLDVRGYYTEHECE